MLDLSLFTFAPVFPGSEEHPATLCVLARNKPDPVAGWFVPVRHTMDASVYLGALCDGQSRPRHWIEIWVQSVGAHGGRRPDPQMNNASLDQRWKMWAAALQEESAESLHAGPWQEIHPRPTYFSIDLRKMIHPTDLKEGRHWELCTDDFVLRKAGLPAFSGTTGRFLHVPSAVADPVFLTADTTVPPAPRTRTPDKEFGFDPAWIPFNPEGGLMLFRALEPYSLRQFKAILEGHHLEAANLESDTLILPEIAPTLRVKGYLQNGHGLMFSGRRGKAGRCLELFLLKTLLFGEVVEQVAFGVKSSGAPYLNLHANDFRVTLGAGGSRLPVCWSFRTALVRSAESLAIEITGGRNRMFQPVGPVLGSEYRPKQFSAPHAGQGTVRIRDVRVDPGDLLVVEGTLADIEASRARRSDLLQLALPVRGQRWILHARVLSDQQLASGELRFETLGQPVRAELRDALTAVRGAPLEAVAFQFQPVASSPCDLYSCAILGLEILLDPTRVRLPLAVDEFLSFARQVALEDPTLPLPTRRAKVLGAEPRFQTSLGPQNLGGQDLTPEDAQAVIPAELWWLYFDSLLRMLPGELPDAWARDLGDVNPAALDTCFHGSREELSDLAERIRGVVFSDWPQNREVLEILRLLDQN